MTIYLVCGSIDGTEGQWRACSNRIGDSLFGSSRVMISVESYRMFTPYTHPFVERSLCQGQGRGVGGSGTNHVIPFIWSPAQITC